MKRSPWRVFAAVCMTSVAFCWVAVIYAVAVRHQSPSESDYIGYWAAGQQLIRGADPYDFSADLRIEPAQGLNKHEARVTPSPPIALPLVLPLGLFSVQMGRVVWGLALIASLSLSLWLLWILHERPADTYVYFLGFAFAPAFACIQAGQLGIFFLLSMVLFLYLQKSRPYLAGAALLPQVLKPHLFLPFVVAMALWSVSRKDFRIVAGFLAAALAGGLITLGFNPHIWPEYSQMMRAVSIQTRFAPTWGVALVMIFHVSVWLRFLPAACGCAWTLWYFLTRRDQWDWTDQGLLVLLVSLLCAPYAWVSDESVLLPAVLYGLRRTMDSGRSIVPFVVVCGAALAELSAGVGMSTWSYIWTVPGWLGLYLYATWDGRTSLKKAIHDEAAAPESA